MWWLLFFVLLIYYYNYYFTKNQFCLLEKKLFTNVTVRSWTSFIVNRKWTTKLVRAPTSHRTTGRRSFAVEFQKSPDMIFS